MKVAFNSLLCMALCSGVLVSTALAGDMYPITLNGTSYQVNSSGQISGTPITQDTMLQAISAQGGIPVSDLLIVYNAGGNAMGDTIDLIEKKTGHVLDTLVGLYFGTDFNRMAITTTDGRDQRRLDYIYTHQSIYALGSAVISKHLAQSGSSSRLMISGSMQWSVAPENSTPSQIVTTKFTVGPKLTF